MKTPTIIFSIALLLLFSPAFVYIALQGLASSIPSLQMQIICVIPFLVGAAILVATKLKTPRK